MTETYRENTKICLCFMINKTSALATKIGVHPFNRVRLPPRKPKVHVSQLLLQTTSFAKFMCLVGKAYFIKYRHSYVTSYLAIIKWKLCQKSTCSRPISVAKKGKCCLKRRKFTQYVKRRKIHTLTIRFVVHNFGFHLQEAFFMALFTYFTHFETSDNSLFIFNLCVSTV